MNAFPIRRAPRLAAAVAALVLALGVAGPASASPETFKRAVTNILFAPLDVVLAPVTAFRTIYTGLRDIDDSTGVRIAYAGPGFIWNMGVQIGAGALREVAGLLEVIPGFFLLPFDADIDPLYAPVDRSDALVNYEVPVIDLPVKFGVLYTAPPTF